VRGFSVTEMLSVPWRFLRRLIATKERAMIHFEESVFTTLRPQIRLSSLVVSPDGQHIAYAARLSEDLDSDLKTFDNSDQRMMRLGTVIETKWVCVCDNGVLPGVFNDIDIIRFSADSQRVAMVASCSDGQRVVVNGEPQDKFESIDKSSLVFSPNSQRVAYIVASRGTSYAIIDGERFGPYSRIDCVVFSPDSRRTAFTALAIRPDSACVVCDGKEQLSFTRRVYDPVFSPDSRRLAYVGRNDDDYRVVVDEVPGHAFSNIQSLQFSTDSQSLAYIATPSGGETRPESIWHEGNLYEEDFVVINEKSSASHWRIQPPLVFHPDGQQVAFVAGLPPNQYVAIGGYQSPFYDYALPPVVLSRDGTRHAFVAVKNSLFYVVIDGKASPYYEGIGEETLAFSSNNEHVVYEVVHKKKRAIVFDGTRGQSYDAILKGSLQFSPEGNHFAYVARAGDDFFVVVDGSESAAYEKFLGQLSFSDPNHAHVFAIRGSQVIRLDLDCDVGGHGRSLATKSSAKWIQFSNSS